MSDPDADRPDADETEDTLFTPAEREVRRAARELRARSEQLISRSQQLNRPKEFLHRFPPRARESNLD